MLYNIPCRSNPMPYYKYVNPTPDYYTLPLTFQNTSNDNVSFYIQRNNSDNNLNLNYSTNNGQSWSKLNYSTSITLTAGQKAMISGINNAIGNYGDYNCSQFKMSGNGRITAYGNINSLACSSNGDFGTGNYVFYGIFEGCTQLEDAYNMKFPSPNIVQQGNISIFKGCTNLLRGPKEIEGQINGNWTLCNLFSGCTNLVYASKINTTMVNTNTFQDFCNRCTHLQKAPFINATTFQTNGNLFQYTFYGCTSLSAIELKFTSWPNNTSNWVYGVASFGLFILPYNYSGSTSRGTDNIPTNWLILKRQSDGSLKYGQSYNGHSEGDVYNGQYGDDPYAQYYQV